MHPRDTPYGSALWFNPNSASLVEATSDDKIICLTGAWGSLGHTRGVMAMGRPSMIVGLSGPLQLATPLPGRTPASTSPV